MQDILKNLNEEQLKAATHIDGAMLILAGAGSGKTKTITTRLAYLIQNGISPDSILTLTFTNKAASEMKKRAMDLIDKNNLLVPPLLCTFHKFGLLFLKLYIHKLGRKNNFVIIDTDDKKKIIKDFSSHISTQIIASEISRFKNSLLSPEEIKNNLNSLKDENSKAFIDNYKEIAEIYEKYTKYLKDNNLLDFDDLLSLPYEILDKDREFCEEISRKFNYIMVDEYQDTNELQFKLLKKLCLTHENLCVVGDDDQSIYGWRGARVENILNFKDEFKDVKIIRLEKNYRSSKQILDAANDLIAHNRNRLGKKLLSVNGESEKIEFINSNDENNEANKIAEKISNLLSQGANANQIAILYRVNALSRSIEEALAISKIPYKMIGGIKFYERAEIKDIISYLRLIVNEDDDFSLKRIINRPKRGLGKATLEKLEEIALINNLSIFKAISKLNEENFNKKALVELKKFTNDLNEIKQSDGMFKIFDALEDKFGIKKYYSELPDGYERVANIDEFYAMLKSKIIEENNFDLEEFLNEITIQSKEDEYIQNAVAVMSIHASKGLEFENVFIIGLEERFFPILGDTTDIEEERRLAYVAITRAKKRLFLSCVNSRFYKGKRDRLEKSRFLSEAGICQGSLVTNESLKSEFKKGDLIKHKLFGIGRVTAVAKIRNELKLSINFGGINRDILSSFVEKI